MSDDIGEIAEFRLVEEVAEALRREFGDGIDAHPGGSGSEAGVVNRAFLTTARVILGGLATPEDELAVLLARALRQVALRRLVEAGVDGERAKRLMGEEPGMGEAWLAYLTLASVSVLNDLLGDRTVE